MADPTPEQQPDTRGAFTRAVFPDGSEPDPRFTLANERTFLAWMRTALAFLAGGIALEAFPMGGISTGVHTALAVAVVCVGVLIAMGAAFRWMRIERAMRHERPLPAPAIIPVLAAAILGAALVVVFLMVMR